MFLYLEFCSIEETIIRNAVNKLLCTGREIRRHNLIVKGGQTPAKHQTWAALWLARWVWSVLAQKNIKYYKTGVSPFLRICNSRSRQPWSKRALNVNIPHLLLLGKSNISRPSKGFEAVPSYTQIPEMSALFKPNIALTEPERENCWDTALIKVSSGRLILITQRAPAQRHELTGLVHGWKASFWSREAQMMATGVMTAAAFDFLFKFQNWKQITPMTSSGGDKSLWLTFIPNWFSHLFAV